MVARHWLSIAGMAVLSISLATSILPDPVQAAPSAGTTQPIATSTSTTTTTTTTSDADPRFAAMPLDVRPRSGSADPGGPVAAFGPTVGAEVDVANAAPWHAAGFTGAGVRIGIIDFFDVPRYWNDAEVGPRPIAGVTARCFDRGADCTDTLFDRVDEGGDDHGVAVAEIIKDMAPDAEILIGTAITMEDYRPLIDWFAASGVTIVNRSLGAYYDGPGDGRGVLDDLAAYATSLGITWINAAGNSGSGQYYRQPVRLAGGRVAFGPTGVSTLLPFNGCVALAGVRWANDWDKPASQRTDYDVYLWDSPTRDPSGGIFVAASEADQREGAAPIEMFDTAFCPRSPGRSIYLEVRWRGGDVSGDVLEILDYGDGIGAFTQAAYSASTAIADSLEPGVVAVGAVDPPGSGVIAFYSSQGPTNDGRISPDLSAASGMRSKVFGGTFAGTSSASPVVAGGAALLAQARLAADPASMGNLLRHLTVDRGPRGPDNLFGAGEFRLPAPPAATTPSPSAFEPLAVPTRVMDTRVAGAGTRTGRVEAGDVVDLPLGEAVPTDATAVAVNITAVGIDRPAFVQALPTLGASLGSYSNLNVDAPDQTRANFAIVPVGSGHSISLSSTGAGDLVVDLLGSFRPAATAVTSGRFVALQQPERVLDTRTGDAPAPLGSDARLAVGWPAGIQRESVGALVVTVTATGATGPGWVQAYPSDRPDAVASTSTVNVAPGITVANTAIVPTGTAGISITGFVVDAGSVDVVVDVVGFLTSVSVEPAEDGRYVPVRPARAFDSRSTGDLRVGEATLIDAAAAQGVEVPDSAAGVVWNMASVGVRRPGFARVWGADSPIPSTSAFNWSSGGEVRAAAVITAADLGRVRVSLHDDGTMAAEAVAGGLIADVFGYFT